MLNNKNKTNEQGRSMVEMLGVLAVVGLLSIMAFAAFRIALNKAKANTIVHDGRMVWMEALANQQPIPDWTASTMANESGKQFYAKRDLKENNYVKVEGVEEEVCEQILGLQKDGELIVLTESLRPFAECQETSDLIFGFDGVGRLIPCAASADCQEEGKEKYNGYCDTEEGYCHECGALELLNEEGTACLCDISKAVSCSDGEGNHWCCGDDTGASNLICGGSAGSCVANETHQCYYNLALTTNTKPLCHYTMTIMGEGDEAMATVTQDTTSPYVACGEKEFCYLFASNTSCAGAGDTNTSLYGLCESQAETAFTKECVTGTATFTQMLGCPVNTYCYINWLLPQCNKKIGSIDNISGFIYGACIPQGTEDMSNVSCPY